MEQKGSAERPVAWGEARGDSDDLRTRSRVTYANGRVIVLKSAAECKNEQEIYGILLSQTEERDKLYEDASVDTERNTVSTKQGACVKLTEIKVIQEVLRCLQRQLHDNDVIHADLKSSHILKDDNDLYFFIDFGYAISRQGHRFNLQEAKGYTAKWTSFDAILRGTVHELDDYEAILTIALFDLQVPNLPAEPAASSNSLKSWAVWKLQLIDAIYLLFEQQHTLNPVVAFVVQKLMLVWTLPRISRKLDNSEKAMLVDANNTISASQHAEDVRNAFLTHLGRKGKSKDDRVDIALTSAREESLTQSQHGEHIQQVQVLHRVQKLNQIAMACPNVVYWKEQRDRAALGMPSTPSTGLDRNFAEYDTLIYAVGQGKWVYDADWKCFGEGEFNVKLLKNIGGKYLYLETTDNIKHVVSLLMKFEQHVLAAHLRPIDVLMLVVGIEIECHGQPFYPERFATMVDDVQHQKWVCDTCKKDLSTNFFYHCPICRRNFCAACKCAHGEAVQYQRGQLDLLPNLSLFTLLLAGRVVITNSVTTEIVKVSREISTANKRKLEQELERYRKLYGPLPDTE